MLFLPRIVYAAPAITLDFDIPPSPWEREAEAVGGYRDTGSGVRVSYQRGATYQRVVTQLRFSESLSDAVMAWALWAQRNADVPFAFRFNGADAATQYLSVLDSPGMGERIRFARAEYRGAVGFDVVLRTTQPGVAPRTLFPIYGAAAPVPSGAGTLTASPAEFTLDDGDGAQTLTADPDTFTLDDAD
jgi:hypothetical protein